MSDADVVDVEAVEVGTELELHRSAAPATLFRTEDPAEVVVRATAIAKPLADVINKQRLFKRIGDKNHVLVEGWTLLGSMLGVVPVVVWTKQLEHGWEARVEARTLAGAVVGAAEAQCLRTEAMWRSRDDYAIRSMAQTRATSRALRGPLGFVVQLAGFQPEPAEDMPEEPAPPASGRKRGGGSTGSRKAADKAADAKPEGSAAAPPPDTSGADMSAARDAAASASAEAVVAADSGGDAPASESHFKAPTGPRGGKNAALEAKELADELVELCNKLGAVDSIPMVEQKRDAGDIAWLKRQIATASKAVARQEQGS